MSGPNLFDYRDRYSNTPGHKTGGTSKDAADAVKPRAPTLAARALQMLQERGPMTPDECADAMGVSLLSIRPRFSELATRGLIHETGERRQNTSGLMANVYAARAPASA